MSYLDEHLLDGERIVYRARLHWIVYLLPLSLLAAAVALLACWQLLVWPERHYLVWAAGVALLLALVTAIGPWIRCRSSEFAVTNKRVLAKLGFIQRDSLETLLSKVEAIGVDQDVIGRMLDFGTITVIGTGGTREAFARIARPLEFRRQVQAQIVDYEERRGVRDGAPGVVTAGAPREERDCPYCAERILTRARVCKHCGREVVPVV